jgi:3-polyprenyl-4-hydroxybenzoate decarboxylase
MAGCYFHDSGQFSKLFADRDRKKITKSVRFIRERFTATIVGVPPMEDLYMGGASVKLFLPSQNEFPEIVDIIALPPEGVFHHLVFVSVRQTSMLAYKIMQSSQRCQPTFGSCDF